MKKLWLAILISLFATIIADLLSRLFFRKKNTITSLKLKQQEEAENIFLSLNSNSCPINFFEKLAKIKHPSVTKHKKFISINHNEKSKTILYPFLFFKPLSPDDLTSILNETKSVAPTKLVITCGEASKETYVFAKNFNINIVILNKFETYKRLYKEYDCFPEITVTYKKDKKLAFKDLLAYSFNKNRTKGYFLSALVIFLASFLVRANLYYCIMASLLILFAFFSQFNWVFNSPEGEIL